MAIRTPLFAERQPGGIISIVDVGKYPGNLWFVDSGCSTGADSDGYGQSPDAAFLTLDYAIGKCTANNGDLIIVLPGHAETYSTTGAKVIADVAGITIIGQGQGADRPTFTFSHTGATWTISAASVKLDNLLFVTGVDLVTTFATISGADCELGGEKGIEVRDTTDIEVIDAFIVTGARFKANILHRGYTGGNANARTLKLNGVAGADINIVALGKATTGVVNFVTAASSDVLIKGIFLVTGTTDLSKNVVDTIGGSTYQVQGFDLAAGCSFSGGSGAAVQKDDVGAITALVGTLVNTGGTATLGGMIGEPANTSIVSRLATIAAGNIGTLVRKSITFSGEVSYAAFTVTGKVAVKVLGCVTTALTNHGDSASVGTATSAAGLIAATAGTAMQTVGQLWTDNAPSKFETFPANYFAISENISVVGTANLVGGVVELYCLYIPLSADGAVAAA